MSDQHECDYPEQPEGNWLSIGKCRICDELPPFEYVQKKMRERKT
jgi:hypothetical protein